MVRTHGVLLALFCAGVGLSTPAFSAAREVAESDLQALSAMSLEEILNVVIISAVKKEQRVEDAPSVVSVITESQLRAFAFRTVADALRQVPGLYVRDDLLHPNVSMRGIDAGLRAWSRNIKVMIDGRPVSYRSDNSNWLGPELIPISAISRIEVIRGPASALYGANAFLGVVNIITKAVDRSRSLSLGAEGGFMQRPCENAAACDANPSGPRLLGGVDVTGARPFTVGNTQIDVLLAAKAAYSDRSGLLLPESSPHFAQSGPRYSGTLSQLASSDDQDRAYSVFGYAQATHPSFGTFRLDGNFGLFNRAGEFTDWSVLTHENRVSMGNWQLAASYKNQVTEWMQLTAALSLSGGGTNGDNHLQIARDNSFWVRKDGGFLGYDASVESYFQLAETLSLRVAANLTVDEHRLPNIYSVRTDEDTGQELALPSYQLPRKQFLEGGGFAQVMWSPLESLSALAGLGFERHSVYGNECDLSACPGLNPRLGLVYSFVKTADHSLYAKAMYGSSFKAPAAELLYGTPYVISGIVGNEQLKSETARSYELALGGNLFRTVNVLVNGFYTDLRNKVEYVQAANFTRAKNSSDVASAGVEGSVQVGVGAFTGYLNLSWQRSFMQRCLLDDESLCQQLGEFSYLFPEVLASAGAVYRLERLRTTASLSGTLVGERWASLSNRQQRVPSESGAGYDFKAYRLPAYLLLDASVSSRLLEWGEGGGLSVTLTAKNLLNQATVEPGFSGIDIPGLGRTVLLSLSVER